MNNPKLMMAIYILASVISIAFGINKISTGNTFNGVLWFIASFCWMTCIYNLYKSNYKK